MDFLPSQQFTQANAYGQSIRYEITREFPIEAIALRLRLSMGALNGTPTSYGFQGEAPWSFIKRVVVTVADGARTRNVVDLSGIGLQEYLRQVAGGLPSGDAVGGVSMGTNVNVAWDFVFMIPFALPNLADPLASTMLLPAPRYNSNVILTITTADTQGAVFSFVGGTTPSVDHTWNIEPTVIRRDVRDPNWLYLDTELAETRYNLALNSTQQLIELQVPGSYSGILLRGYNSLAVNGNGLPGRGDPSASSGPGVPGTTTGEFSLRMLSNVIRRFRWGVAQAVNEMSLWEPVYNGAFTNSTVPCRVGVAPSVYLDFVNDRAGQVADDLGSVLDTNPLMATGTRLQLFADNNATSGTQYLQLVTHRIFGNLQDLKPKGSSGA